MLQECSGRPVERAPPSLLLGSLTEPGKALYYRATFERTYVGSNRLLWIKREGHHVPQNIRKIRASPHAIRRFGRHTG